MANVPILIFHTYGIKREEKPGNRAPPPAKKMPHEEGTKYTEKKTDKTWEASHSNQPRCRINR